MKLGVFDEDFCFLFKAKTGKDLVIKMIEPTPLNRGKVILRCEDKFSVVDADTYNEYNLGLVSACDCKPNDLDWVAVWLKEVIKELLN